MQTQRHRPWRVMWAVFIAGVAIAINTFKVPPLMRILMADLGVDMTTGGWLMSVSSISTVFLSIPAALLLSRFGIRRTGAVALAFTCAGAVGGALAPSAGLLLLSRAVEGLGSTLITVTATLAISLWFEPRERGLPMGIWSAWVPVGNVIMFNSAPALEQVAGWRGVWWVGAGVVAAALVLYLLWVDAPIGTESSRVDIGRFLSAGLSNGRAWLLGLGFATFSFAIMSYNTWSPTFLADTLGMAPARAGFYASLLFAGGIAGNLLAGWLMNRVPARFKLLLAAYAGNALLMTLGFRLGAPGVVPPYMITLGLVSNFIPALVFTLVPEIAGRPVLVGLTMAVVAMQSSGAGLLGPPVLGALVSRSGWQIGGVLLPAGLLGGMMIAWILGRLRAAEAGDVSNLEVSKS